MKTTTQNLVLVTLTLTTALLGGCAVKQDADEAGSDMSAVTASYEGDVETCLRPVASLAENASEARKTRTLERAKGCLVQANNAFFKTISTVPIDSDLLHSPIRVFRDGFDVLCEHAQTDAARVACTFEGELLASLIFRGYGTDSSVTIQGKSAASGCQATFEAAYAAAADIDGKARAVQDRVSCLTNESVDRMSGKPNAMFVRYNDITNAAHRLCSDTIDARREREQDARELSGHEVTHEAKLCHSEAVWVLSDIVSAIP